MLGWFWWVLQAWSVLTLLVAIGIGLFLIWLGWGFLRGSKESRDLPAA